eukprot:m.320894 g.320894  ORF g.320894 m.320894 type:complete len:145 (-) comp24667_c0_seq1:23-457(-)
MATQESEVGALFSLFSKKKSKLPAASVGDVVRAYQIAVSEKQLSQAMAAAGIKGEADLKQVMTVVQTLSALRNDDMKASIKRALHTFDQEDNGVISVTELSHVLTSMGEKLSRDDIDEIFREAEVDAYGYFNLESFVETLTGSL